MADESNTVYRLLKKVSTRSLQTTQHYNELCVFKTIQVNFMPKVQGLQNN